MKAIRFLLVFALVSISASLLFTGAGYAAPFDCEGDTIPREFVNVDLDTGTCHGGLPTGSDEISIDNQSEYAYAMIDLGVFNGANATVSGADGGDKTISSDNMTMFYCTSMSCTISITGTYKAKPFSFDLTWQKDSENVKISNTSGARVPEIEVAETGQKQGDVADGGTLDQGAPPAGSATSLTFTVTNSGDGDLTLETATSSDPKNVTVNSITSPAPKVSPGGTTTFDVEYTPTSGGPFSFDLSFDNSDSDEDPYNFTVSGTAVGPEITVKWGYPAQEIANGGTLAQGTKLTHSVMNLSFTVTNSGNADLTLENMKVLSSSNITNAGFLGGSSKTISPGGNAILDFLYTPTDPGAFSLEISFDTNDSDEDPFTFTLSGTAVAPEISVNSSEGGAIADGGTDTIASKPLAGSAATITYTIKNDGTAPLSVFSPTPSSNVTSTKNVTVNSFSLASTSLSAGETTTLEVNYTVTTPGAFNFAFHFSNGDIDKNPFNITASGNAKGAPEVVVEWGSPAQEIANGGTLAYGNQPAGSETVLSFTVTNSGNADLTLGNMRVVSSSNVTNAGLRAYGKTTVWQGEETFIAYAYTPINPGAFSLEVSFDNNDSDENPYTFTISGTATQTPEIEVAETGQKQGDIADGGTLDQGTQAAGSTTTLTFTVTNSGTADLTLGTATSSSASNVTVNAISAPGSTTMSPSGTTTFDVKYTPTLVGAFSFDLSFDNSDGDEAPYNFTISGSATGAPEISVAETGQGQGAIADGGTLDQGTRTPGTATTLTFTVTNSGTADLVLVRATYNSPSNVTVNDISGFGFPPKVSPGGTKTFDVQYTPTSGGAFSFNLSLGNDDSDENPYTFTVSGTALAPAEISVNSSEGGAIVDGGTDTIASKPTAGSAASVTYTISNSGAAPLSITAPTISTNVTSTTNVTVNSLTLASTSVPADGTTTLEVNYTPTTSGDFSFAFNFANSDSDESPFNITASGSSVGVPHGVAASSGDGQATPINTSFANPLVAIVTDSDGNALSGVSVTFGAPSSGASLTFASTGTRTETVVTGADGKATSSTMTANATASGFSGGALTPYSVSASVTGLTSARYSLTNARDSAADIAKTSDVIATFMTSRADRIVSAQPNIVSRLRSPFGRQSQVNRFSLNAGPGSQTVNLEASLLAFVNKINAPRVDTLAATPSSDPFAVFDMLDKDKTGTAPGLAYAAQAAATETATEQDRAAPQEDTPESGLDAWVQASFAATQNGTSDQRNGLFFAGVDYRFSDSALVGILGELDLTDETNTTATTDGVGWMVGPYAVVRLSENLYLDGQATYGQSDNHVNALGPFTDQFQTERLLLQAGLTGDFRIEDFTFNPFVRATYFFEEQKSYVDSLGNTIPDQTFDLGRLEFGPKLSWDVPTSGEIDLGLNLGLSGIYDFDPLSNGTATTPGMASADASFRARIEGGVDIGAPDTSFQIKLQSFYDGIGVDDFQSYGASLNLGASF